MRKLLSILLLALLALSPVSPLLAESALAEANLPLCCRGDGAHKCARMAGMAAMQANPGTTPHIAELRAKCPCPPASMVSVHAETFARPTELHVIALAQAHPAGVPQTECRRRIALDRSRRKRGPPTLLLAA
jgi:hypothetical protein